MNTNIVDIECTYRLISPLAYLCEQEIEEVPHLVSDLRVLKQDNVDTMTPKIYLESDLEPSYAYELFIDYSGENKPRLIQKFNNELDDKPLYFSEENKENCITFSQGMTTLKKKERKPFFQSIKGLEAYRDLVTPREMATKLSMCAKNAKARPTVAQLAFLIIKDYQLELWPCLDDYQLAINYRRSSDLEKTQNNKGPLLAVKHYDDKSVIIKNIAPDFTFNFGELKVLENGQENKNFHQVEENGKVKIDEIEVIYHNFPVKDSYAVQMTWEKKLEELTINLFVNNKEEIL